MDVKQHSVKSSRCMTWLCDCVVTSFCDSELHTTEQAANPECSRQGTCNRREIMCENVPGGGGGGNGCMKNAGGCLCVGVGVWVCEWLNGCMEKGGGWGRGGSKIRSV